MGFEAIRYPSVTGAGENLAIFADRLSPSSCVRIVNEEWEFPKFCRGSSLNSDAVQDH